jgi:hypothetical protein
MISLAEAQYIAARWAHRQSLRRGYACIPHVDELSLGYAVWMRLPPEVRTEPGEDVTTIIDRETGRLSHWPPAPTVELDERYRARRDAVVAPHQTSDPEAELRREADRLVSPSVAAHITLGDRLFRARGAKGDVRPRHHPLVAQWLETIPVADTIRGAERHAELLVVSDVLQEADRTRAAAGNPPLTLDEAHNLLEHGQFETFHIRERGDQLGGQPAELCATCCDVLTRLGVVPWSRRTLLNERRVSDGTDPQPGRFPQEVAWELAAGGWDLSLSAQREQDSGRALAKVEARAGLEAGQQRFPAAVAAYAEFLRVAPSRRGPGIAQRIRWFRIGSGQMTGLADPLHELGTIVGARMFPLGVEGFDEAVLAIDERGRVFSLDQGGEWFIGESLDEALTALVTGAAAARIRNNGTW